MSANPLISLGVFGSASPGQTLSESFSVAAATLERLAQAEPIPNSEGLECTITAFAINRVENCAAWLEWRYDETKRIELHKYYLCARTPEASFLSWEVECYNPYFGVFPESLTYEGSVVRLVYRDKHATYAAEMNEFGLVTRTAL